MKAAFRSSYFLFAGIALMIIVFLLNWSWNIYDMDDGSTLAYHLLGRDVTIQPPYSAYDSMCDYILSSLPASYYLVFSVMVIWTFISSVAVFIFLALITERFIEVPRNQIFFYSLLFLLAAPDFLYLTLSYKSNLIGLSFILLSHYLLIRSNSHASFPVIVISALLFGFGAACRWNLVVYGLAIAADVLFIQYAQYKFKKSWQPLLWGVLALAAFFLFVYISGYDINSFLQVILWGKEYVSSTDFQLIAMAADSINFFTPVMVIALLAGLFICIKAHRKYSRVLVFLATSLPIYIYIGFSPNLKYLLTVLPALFIVFMIGTGHILNNIPERTKWLKPVFILLLLAPWLIGIQVNTPTTLWGPGFDIKEKPGNADYGKSLDERMSLDNLRVGFIEGFAISTAEGTKPLWGNFYVLFGGKIRRLNNKLGNEASHIIDISANQHIDLYTDRMNPLLMAALCKKGFRTTDSATQKGLFTTRIFSNGKQSITVKRFNSKKDITNYPKVKAYISDRFIAHFTYSSLMADFIKKAPKENIWLLEQTGAFSGYFKTGN